MNSRSNKLYLIPLESCVSFYQKSDLKLEGAGTSLLIINIYQILLHLFNLQYFKFLSTFNSSLVEKSIALLTILNLYLYQQHHSITIMKLKPIVVIIV